MEHLCRGRTVLTVAHKESAMAWTDRTVFLEGGVVKQDAQAGRVGA